jgi:hypothetical protein
LFDEVQRRFETAQEGSSRAFSGLFVSSGPDVPIRVVGGLGRLPGIVKQSGPHKSRSVFKIHPREQSNSRCVADLTSVVEDISFRMPL